MTIRKTPLSNLIQKLSFVWIFTFAFYISTACADSYGSPTEETFYSANGQYYLHVLPKDDFNVEWTFANRNGSVLFQRKSAGGHIIGVSNDGNRIVVVGKYDRNIDMLNGLLLINRKGEIVRHISTPLSLPSEKSLSQTWWFWRGKIINPLKLFSVQLIDGSRRYYLLENGNMVFILPALWQAATVMSIVYILAIVSRSVPLDMSQQNRNKLSIIGSICKSICAALASMLIITLLLAIMNYCMNSDIILRYENIQFLYYQYNKDTLILFIEYNTFVAFIASLFLLKTIIRLSSVILMVTSALIIANTAFIVDSRVVESVILAPLVAFAIIVLWKQCALKREGIRGA